MKYEQTGMDLTGTSCWNYGAVKEKPGYGKGKGMIAAYGNGPRGKKCHGCGHFSSRLGADHCSVVPWAEVNSWTRACGKYETGQK